MIIEQYYPDPEGMAALYKRWRSPEGELIEETVTDFQPYTWVRADTPPRLLTRLSERYYGLTIDRSTKATGLYGEDLIRVNVMRPNDLHGVRREIETWEADLRLPDRYLIDEVSEMPDWTPRVWHLDLEWDPVKGFTTVIAFTDSHTNESVAYCWSERSARELGDDECIDEVRHVKHEYEDGTTAEFSYRRVICNSERAIYTRFLDHLEEVNPDVFVAHALMWADLPHMVGRLTQKKLLGRDAYRRLSPLGRVLRPRKDKRGGYDYTDQPVAGRLCFDTAAPLKSGTGFERVWKDSGRPQLANLKLATIAEELGYANKFDMDVFTGWYERFDEYVDYCMQDVLLLKRIDEDNHILNFYLALQRFCGVMFESCHNVTRFARGLLSRRTDNKAPTSSGAEKVDYEGAFIPPPKPGRYEGVACVDYKGLYPSIILSDNLSWETQVDNARRGEENIKELKDGTCWDQSKRGLLPTIVEELFEVRDAYKKNMRAAETKSERSGWNTMQLAVKRVMASLYGMCASTHWGWAAPAIASAITSRGRESIRFLMEESEAQGYSALYGHTDSAFVQIPFDEAEALAKHLTEEVQRQLDASHLFVEFEAYMPYWIVAGKNLYYGICSWPPEDEGKSKSARFGKISTLAPVSRTLERDLLTIVCNGGTENDATSLVRPLAKRIQNGEIPLKDLCGVTRIQKPLNNYAPSVGVPGVKGARYYNAHLAERYNGSRFDEGDSAKWVYVKDVPDGLPKTDIVSFHEESELDEFILDYDTMVLKLITKKIEPIYKALEWNIDYASGKAKPKSYW